MSPRKQTKLECSVANALDSIGDYWSLMILRDLMIFGGTRRFDSLQDGLEISRNILTERLRTLVGEEIIRKVPIAKGARRMEYKLTRKGWELVPVFLSLDQWCTKWEKPGKSRSYHFVDKESGEEVWLPGVHSAEGSPIGLDDIRIVPLTPEAEEYLSN